MKSPGLILALVLFATNSVSEVAAEKPIPPPQFIPVEVPGATATFVYGVNNAGVMVGLYDIGQNQHGFAAFGGKFLTIDVPPPARTTCTGVNASNTISGFYVNPPGQDPPSRGFVYQDRHFVDIGPPLSEAVANGLNDLGEVVGQFTSDHEKTYHGFLYDGTNYQTLDVPDADVTSAIGVNNQGLVLVQYGMNGHKHAAIYDGSEYTTIDVPEATDTFPAGINNFGDVSFTWFDARANTHAALLHAGQYYKFMVPNSNETAAGGVNDKDVIVGEYYDHTLTVTPGYKLIP